MDPTTTCRFTAAHRRAPPPLCAVRTAINTHRRAACTTTRPHPLTTFSVISSLCSIHSRRNRLLVARIAAATKSAARSAAATLPSVNSVMVVPPVCCLSRASPPLAAAASPLL
ncbi:Centromere/kinetochore protein zw10 [Sesbania bispinosa]|nr:Centromere/kinetochore protein zw10 [Sesbania bispinosa]